MIAFYKIHRKIVSSVWLAREIVAEKDLDNPAISPTETQQSPHENPNLMLTTYPCWSKPNQPPSNRQPQPKPSQDPNWTQLLSANHWLVLIGSWEREREDVADLWRERGHIGMRERERGRNREKDRESERKRPYRHWWVAGALSLYLSGSWRV